MYYDGTIHIEEEDQCYSCEYFLKGVTCPLLEALALGVVNLEGDVLVRNCGFFKQFKRTLHLVEPPQDSPPSEEGERKTGI
ncbi:MAG: hypothetical protein K2X66_02405 [Cyanobacteria bacterium]|jgi:hypothetical protein|nr:hypothetical protein [Cyanobacteriota bacterium]